MSNQIKTIDGLINLSDIPYVTHESSDEKQKKLILFFIPIVVIIFILLYNVHIQKQIHNEMDYICENDIIDLTPKFSKTIKNLGEKYYYITKPVKTILIHDEVIIDNCIMKNKNNNYYINEIDYVNNNYELLTVLKVYKEVDVSDIILFTEDYTDKLILVTLLDYTNNVVWRNKVKFNGHKHYINLYEKNYNRNDAQKNNLQLGLPSSNNYEKLYVNDNIMAVKLTQEDEDYLPYII